MIKERVAKSIRRFERKRLPNLRYNKNYKTVRTIILIPLAVVLSMVDWVVKKSKMDRVSKPQSLDKLRNIVNGWTNLAFPTKEVEALALERAEVCSKCPFAVKSGMYSVVVDNKTTQIQGMKCSLCGCGLSAKVRSVDERCPEGKW
jgi:hypothetical protein